MPKISVCVPCYQYGEFMHECLESILSQDCRDIEVLIGDNASTDHTARIAREFQRRDSRVHVETRPENLGYARNVNLLFSKASGQYCTLLGCDDRYLRDDFLSRAVHFLDAAPEAAFLHSAYQDVDHAGQLIRTFQNPGAARVLPGQNELENYFRLRFPWISSVVARTALVQNMGGFDLSHEFAWDLGWYINMAIRGDVAYLPDANVTHRQHRQSLSGQVDERQKFEHCRRVLELLRPRFLDQKELLRALEKGIQDAKDFCSKPQQEPFAPELMERLQLRLDAWRKMGRKLVIYGAGMHTRTLLQRLDFSGIDLRAAADKDSQLVGADLDGLEIIAPGQIEACGAETVLISSQFHQAAIELELRQILPEQVEIALIYD